MTSMLSPLLLSEFSHFITDEIGLYFPKQKWPDLERGIQAASQAFQFEDVESCMHWLMSSSLSQKQTEILASFLTVGETYFLRDIKTFRILEENILPPLIHKRNAENQKHLRIWSAGCASGEEPYSIAIILRKLLPDIKNWNITLLATDINTEFLKKLSKGIYSEWSFRDVPDEIKAHYFKKTAKEGYEILPIFKNLVEPFYHNIVRDPCPSLMNNTNAMDIIFCRNVLMYFSPILIHKVVNKFFDCLVNDGCLIVSPSEIAHPYFTNFKLEMINGVTIFRKKDLEITKTVEPLQELIIPTDIVKEEKPKLLILDYKALAQECANQGKLKEALSWNDKAISENKTDADLYYLRALILLEMGNNEDAIIALERVHYLNPDFVLAYIVLGNIFHKIKKKPKAKKQFGHALALLNNLNSEEMLGDINVGRLIDIVRSMSEME